MYKILAAAAACAFAAASFAATRVYQTDSERLATPPAVAIDAVKAAIRNSMKDPDSTQFRDVWYEKTYVTLTVPGEKCTTTENSAGQCLTAEVCGSVNAKNAYGGYVGYRRFIGADEMEGEPDPDGIMTPEEEEAFFVQSWKEFCTSGQRFYK